MNESYLLTIILPRNHVEKRVIIKSNSPTHTTLKGLSKDGKGELMSLFDSPFDSPDNTQQGTADTTTATSNTLNTSNTSTDTTEINDANDDNNISKGLSKLLKNPPKKETNAQTTTQTTTQTNAVTADYESVKVNMADLLFKVSTTTNIQLPSTFKLLTPFPPLTPLSRFRR
jgi:hypothetical protein